VSRILHVLSQRPSRTGSGVTLDSLVRLAAGAGWRQRVVVGVPAEAPPDRVGGLPAEQLLPLRFGEGPLDFPVPGMSDVMPYTSTRFSAMSERQLESYRAAWREHLATIVREFRPDLIHAHHVWIVSSMLKEIAPELPVVVHCHATGLRQMRLAPHVADAVRSGCARNDRFVALHAGDAAEIVKQLAIDPARVQVVGAGYREDLFHATGRAVSGGRVIYVGKYSRSKGLPWLLDAVERLAAARPELELHVVGSGSGDEAETLRARMESMPRVVLHGMLAQAQLADLLRSAAVFVLPSLYEGVPLVAVEALACGCRPLLTDLPGVREELAPHLGEALLRIPAPRLLDVDRPDPGDLPRHVETLTAALGRALDAPVDPATIEPLLARFRWSAVFERVESIWRELGAGGG
jgi:glycosyltransferase involved in cell wall biosynthesis